MSSVEMVCRGAVGVVEDVAFGLHQEVRCWVLACGGAVERGCWGCVGCSWVGRRGELCLCLELLLAYNGVAA